MSAFLASMSSRCRRYRIPSTWRDYGALHLYGFAFDGVPDCVLIFLGTVGEDELPGCEIHFVGRCCYHHVVGLFGRCGSGLDGETGGRMGLALACASTSVQPSSPPWYFMYSDSWRIFRSAADIAGWRYDRSAGGIPDRVEGSGVILGSGGVGPA